MEVPEVYMHSRVMVVDDDEIICESLTEMLEGWGLEARAYTKPQQALEGVGGNKYDVILLDIFILDVCGLDMISQFGDDLKVIIITGYADKEIAIRALKLGAFDLLEKPFENELLYHSLVRAFRALEGERESKRLIEDLRQSRAELLMQQQRLEDLTGRLLETNKALSVFVSNIEQERQEVEKQIAVKLRNLIIPMVIKLKNDPNFKDYSAQFAMLAAQVEDLTAGFALDSRIAVTLSTTELQIASLIKCGVTTEEIARQMHIAPSTVRTHRKNIRRKLKINSAPFNLKNFLSAKS